MPRRLFAVVLAICVFMGPRLGSAAYHIAVIDEVMTSYGGDATKQFVEIRMLTFFQTVTTDTVLAAFDASGAYIGDVLVVPGDVPNSGVDKRWIMATSAMASTVPHFTPDFIIPSGIIPTGGGMVCWGGGNGGFPISPPTWSRTDFTNYVDCVAYGTYSGPTNVKIGMATSIDADGHSLQRVGNTHNNSSDFACGDPANPTNNVPETLTLPATSPCPPTPTPTVTPTATASPTPTLPANDAVVLAPKPLTVKINAGDVQVVKTLKVKVQNGNVAGSAPFKLIAAGCPGAVTGLADFDKNTAGAQETITLAAGKSAKALVPVTISSGAVTSFNEKSPSRCVLTFTTMADLPINVDPNPGNDVAQVELNVIDLNDPNQTASPNHDSTTASLKPVTVKISDGTTTVPKIVKLKVGNADAGEDPGHPITVTLGAGTCPVASVGLPDFDKNSGGVQNTVTVNGNKTATGAMTLTINSGDFITRNAKSPTRCTQSLCVAGPMGNSDPNASNDCTQLTIDVIDQNDF